MVLESDKKIVVFLVLKILKEYSDENHLMTYNQILDKLDDLYGIRPDIKSVASNVNTLIAAGYDIIKNGYKGCYLSEREFESGELMYLVDAVNSSNAIPARQAKDLIEKLTAGCSKYERKRYKPISKMDKISNSKNKALFYVIEVLSEAIEKGKKVKFNYNEYKITKELEPRFKGKEFIINPYFLVNSRGKYYLVCNYDKYDDVSNYKIECISNVTILDEDVKPIKSLKDMENFTKQKYIDEHIYMTYGKTINATLKVTNPKYIGDIIDWFGDDITIVKNSDPIEVRLTVNEQALIYWALQYGEHVEIIMPKETREKIKQSLKNILNKYEDEE